MGPDDRHAQLLIVPGLGLDARSWAPTVRHLGWPAAVLLLPGYGQPAPADADLSPAALAEYALAEYALADARPGSRAPHGRIVLAGHSSGCQVAAHLAARAPRFVDRLVLVAPTTDPRARGWAQLAQRWFRTAAHEDPRQVPELLRQYAATGVGVMARAMEAARHDGIRDALGRVTCPVLVLRGPRDRICPADWAGSLCASETSAGATLQAGGHMIPWTQGAAVARRIRDFLESEGTTGGGPRL